MLLNGTVMSKDIEVASVKNNEVSVIDKARCPFLLQRCSDISVWLENRSIDKNRPSSRRLRKVLNIRNTEESVISCNAVSVTDTYWFKPQDSVLTYKDVLVNNDDFSEVALGSDFDINLFEKRDKRTYEFTNTGSYEKCWKIILGNWYLCKRGTTDEVDSEATAYEVGRLLGFNMAEYISVSDTCIMSKNFTGNQELCLETMYSFTGESEDYADIVPVLKTLESKYDCSFLKEYIDLLVMDCLVLNVDRHSNNLGVLRDSTTGRVVGLAPNYDNNMCLSASRTQLTNTSPSMFFDDVVSAIKLADIEYILPVITEAQLSKIMEKSVKDFIWRNYVKLSSMLS